MSSNYHIPVLLEKSVEALAINPDGVYVDATFGGGGHSKAILSRINNGKLIAFDRDADALTNIPPDENLILVNHDFVHLKNFLRYFGAIEVDGILADLGLSSYQVDTAERGFSFRFDAALDMRMDRQNPISASTLVNERSVGELQHIFSAYGEVRNARTLAEAIGRNRKREPITTTGQLARIAEEVLPAKETLRKYLAPVFQALRIAVNDEMEGLRAFLIQALEVLKPGGRLAVITYHSLEDRPVKHFIQTGHFGKEPVKDVFGNLLSPWVQPIQKPVLPDSEEIARNPRSRSAKLRVGVKA